MKRIRYIGFAVFLAGWFMTLALGQSTPSSNQATPAAQPATASPQSGAQPGTNNAEPSLGDYARAMRKDRPHSAKKFDNDNLPQQDKISVVGDKDADNPSDKSADSQDAAPPSQANEEKPKVMPGQTQEQRQQVYDKWQEKITVQQGQIDQIARELDLDQREYRLRAAAFYADAGERLRNQADWDKQDAEYKQKIADQQKALDDAKQKLSDLQEEARRAGVPNSAQQPANSTSSE